MHLQNTNPLPGRLLSWFKRSSLAVGVLAFAGVSAPLLHACDACNLSFSDEILTGDRAETIVARDVRKAMENQRGLPLLGFSSPTLIRAQNEKIAAALPVEMTAKKPVSSSTTSASASTADTAEETKPAPTAAPSTAPLAVAAAKMIADRPLPDYMKSSEFIEIIEADYGRDVVPYSTVPQDAPVDKTFTMHMSEGSTYLGNGVVYEGFLVDGKIPGPTFVADVGDVIEMVVVNEGNVPHGASIHSAYTQTSKYVGKIGPKSTKKVRFRAMTPGIYLYHCAPGGHAIPMHVLAGQYGMMVIRPKEPAYQLEKELGRKPDLEVCIIQHELYSSGQRAVTGQPDYTMFNGRLFRYVEEPLKARPGDYVRINFLNVGPNQLSTFHIVGILWDYVYWQGNPDARLPGGQTVTAGPSDSFVIEFRMPPDEGAYTILTHAVGSASRGAIGLLVCENSDDIPKNQFIPADGPSFTPEEMEVNRKEATRIIAPFGIGTHPIVDSPVVSGPETKEVHVSIMGNSFHPKILQIAPGTKVTWTNEDVFTYIGGEYAGIHNVVAMKTPEGGVFASPMLAHAESHTHTFEISGQYDYICVPHPYMKGRIIVTGGDDTSDAEKADAPEAAEGTDKAE